MDLSELFGTVIITIITVYIAFILINNFSKITPEFASYGWIIFSALIAGVVLFFKYGLFNK